MKKYLLLILLLKLLTTPVAGQMNGRIIYLTDEDGLPQNKIKFIKQDTLKYLWIGTQNGIVRFDGYTFQQFPELISTDISHLFIDHENQVWVGTHNGLYLLNRLTNYFEPISSGDIRDIAVFKDRICYITPDYLWILKEDQKGKPLKIPLENHPKQLVVQKETVWLGFGQQGGLKRFALKEEGLLLKKSYFQDQVVSFLKELQGNLWVGLADGSLYAHAKEDTFQKVAFSNKYIVKDIIIHQNNYWIATDGNGIFVLDQDYKLLQHYKHSPLVKSISSNNIHDLHAANNGNLWIGTYDAGITYLSSDPVKFKSPHEHLTSNINAHYNGTACFEDSEKNLWLGTQYGFSYLNMKTNAIQLWDAEQCRKMIGGTKVLAFAEDKNHDIWVGTYDGGLAKFRENKFEETFYPFSNGVSQEQNINFIFNPGGSKIIINSMYSGLGALNIKNGKFEKFHLIKGNKKIESYITFALRYTNNQLLAYVHGEGLYCVNYETNELNLLIKTDYEISDFIVDAEGNYWFATRGFGLVKTDTAGKVIKKYTMEDGLSSNFLLRIEQDERDALWISSISGLVEINIKSEKITTYDHRHGLPSREFTPYGSTSLSNGNILFGTVRGFALTNPNERNPSSRAPNVTISDITFHNKSITELEDPILEKPVEAISSVKLPYDKNSFTIHFHSDDYNLPKYNKYAYRLIGLEENWIKLNENHQTNYTNLSPGKYIFQVKSFNKFNIESQNPKALIITILPPWYLTNWAYLLYTVLLTMIVIGAYKIISYRIHMKKELEFSTYKLENLKELHEKKLQFFTNITHDFKTPLTLVSAPLGDLLNDKGLDKTVHEKLNLIKSNADRLYHLIVDLLDFRKVEGPVRQKLEASKTDLSELFADIYHPFKSACEEKNITLQLKNSCKTPAYVDISKLKRILWNLLSNALKFTPRNGQIKIICKKIEVKGMPVLELKVNDTGCGLNKSDLKNIFEAYYQTEGSNHSGSGLGLAIVKSLVDVHRGKVKVKSKPGKGTSFIIQFPCELSQYEPAEISHDAKGNYTALLYEDHKEQEDISENGKYNQECILIVEDNLELNQYLKSLFSKRYKVFSSFNGKDALQIAQTKNLDVIVSDVMMPEMDGYSFCSAIKNDVMTSHIPILLLTANSTTKNQITGMHSGADAYITKPFKSEFLMASVQSILENRKKLRKKFQGLDKIEKDNKTLSPKDYEFIENLKSFLSSRIDDSEIGIEDVAKALNCSKSSLIRKVKALTGTTPNNFMKIYKLNIAYGIIVKEDLNVNEVAYRTGFSDPNYFTTCFKKQFGINPSQVSSSTSLSVEASMIGK